MPNKSLPPGQRAVEKFDRFGLGRFINIMPNNLEDFSLSVSGHVESPTTFLDELKSLPRVDQNSDLHCVTTWSKCGLNWSGVRFRDFYEQLVVPVVKPDAGAIHVVLKAGDGFNCCMLLEDLLADDVILADSLEGASPGLDHGAPLRLVAPAHYGYKNVKYLNAIEFWRDRSQYKFPFPYPSIMDHPRARVAHEERILYLPNWLIRPFYRIIVAVTEKLTPNRGKATKN